MTGLKSNLIVMSITEEHWAFGLLEQRDSASLSPKIAPRLGGKPEKLAIHTSAWLSIRMIHFVGAHFVKSRTILLQHVKQLCFEITHQEGSICSMLEAWYPSESFLPS